MTNLVQPNQVRVLVVDDNPATTKDLVGMLAGQPDTQVLELAGDRERLAAAVAFQPHVILMDINVVDRDGLHVADAVRQRTPSCQVIAIISVQSEQDYFRRAMLVGASDFLTRPFTAAELVTRIRSAYQRAHQWSAPPAPPVTVAPSRRAGQILAFFGPKGGVGRTTIAVNVAVSLRQTIGKTVALMDASLLFGDVGVMMNVSAQHSIADLAQPGVELEGDLVDEVLATHLSGVRVLPAPPRPELAEMVGASQVNALLHVLRDRYDFVVVDTPPTLNDVTLTALEQADRIVVVTTLEMTALRNMRLYLDTAQALGYRSSKHMLVVNRADSAGGIRIQDVEQHARQKVDFLVGNDWKLATLAANRGIPLVLSNPDSPVAKNIIEIARGLSGENKTSKGSAPAHRLGLFRRG